MPQVKGLAVRGLLKSVKESGWSIPAVIAAMPEAQRAVFARPIVVSAWYPYDAFASLLSTVDQMHGQGDLALCRDLGRTGAVRDLGTTFRIISIMTSVEFVVKRGQVFWSKYCDTGTMVLEKHREGGFKGRLEGFPGVAHGHCRMIEGWLEGMGTALGAKDMATQQTRCVHQGADCCEFEARWSGLKGMLG
jgi:hypothetical protein